ncbi:MAG: hypothetical protein ACOC0H_04710 [Thermodesulfobacteriota bacterium]
MSKKNIRVNDMTIDRECSSNCESSYRECISGKEDESVCRMKRAHCRCSCS